MLKTFSCGHSKMKIIAESASNHQGDLEYLKALALAAKNAGADYFTVQVLDTDAFCDPSYERRGLVEKIVLSRDVWSDVFAFCRDIDLPLIPCAADLPSLEFCLAKGFRLLKLHGTDLLNFPMLDAIARSEARVLVETQLATERDIDQALSRLGRDRIECLIHGYSNYPTEDEELNLGALDYMRERWQLPVGFADHTLETGVVPMMAMAKGAVFLEKHITLSRNHRRYDWEASLNPDEFAVLMATTRRYCRTLGTGIKHPSRRELEHREVMYKRCLEGDDGLRVVRADRGPDYYDRLYAKYDPEHIVTVVIARLKSTRLKRKVLLPFHNDAMVFDLCRYSGRNKSSRSTIIATSWLESDDDLVHEAERRGFKVFRGHPTIVIHRLLDIAEEERASAVFRITGDMPFADPQLMERMALLRKEHNLDYVRAMNLPLGMSAELFSTSYLQKLYQRMNDPRESEYLGWFVILDREARKGCLKVEYDDVDLSEYSLTVDYQEDMDRCQNLLAAIGKENIENIDLTDILAHLELLDKISPDALIKLPAGVRMSYREFVGMQWSQGYLITDTFTVPSPAA
jgi:N,N'-diacetyllegionaminate synthase